MTYSQEERKTCVKTTLTFFAVIAFCGFEALSQNSLPPQIRKTTKIYKCMLNTTIQVNSTLAAQADAVSDGQGHHYVIQTSSNQIQHYLFNDLGEVVHQATFATNAVHPSITSRNGKIHVVVGNQSSNQIEVWESSNAGVSWNNSLGSRSMNGTLTDIDTYEDDERIHIVYTTDNSTLGTNYRALHLTAGWLDLWSRSVNGQSSAGVLPAIIATAESAHVFSSQGMFSFKLPTSGAGSWQLSTPPGTPALSAAAEVFVSPISGTPPERHMFLGYANSDFYLASRKYLDPSSQWDIVGAIQGGANQGTRPTMLTTTQYPFGTYSDAQYVEFAYDAAAAIFWRRFTEVALGSQGTVTDVVNWHDGTQCPPPLSVNPGGAAFMGSNVGSIAFFWRDDDGTLYFRRKPIGMKGSISDNYAMTDTNWIVGDVNVGDSENQVELRFKAGSVTFILGEYDVSLSEGAIWRGPGILSIASGSTVVVEAGAKIYLQAPAATRPIGGTIQLGDGVAMIVPSGALIEAQAGTQFKFGASASITFAANTLTLPTSGTAVIFTKSGGSNWNGIGLSGTNTIRNATISYANTGISVSTGSGSQPVTITSGTSINNCGTGISVGSGPTTISSVSFTNCNTGLYTKAKYSVTLQNSTFTGCGIGVSLQSQFPQLPRTISGCTFTSVGTAGIVIDNFSSVTITGNTITGPGDQNTGISLSGSSPDIRTSTIQQFKYGITCLAGSSPSLAIFDIIPGYNVIKNNDQGLVAENYSSPFVGLEPNGQNSIFQNTSWDVHLSSNSHVLGESNWWGSAHYPPGNFSVDVTSSFDFDPWLEEDPNSPNAPLRKHFPTAIQSIALMRQALLERMEGRYSDAANTLKSIIQSQEASIAEKEWSVSQLLVVAQRSPTLQLSQYLEVRALDHPHLSQAIESVLPGIMFAENRPQQALVRLDRNILTGHGSHLRRQALYQKFLHVLHENEDIARAENLLGVLAQSYPQGHERRLAQAQLAAYVASRPSSPSGNPGINATEKTGMPQEFKLFQNYPNPFNPSTQITYLIPRDGLVTLSVFDVLGREVQVLENSMKHAGTHTVSFNASKVSSGVYLYRLQVGSFVAVKKMIVAK